MTPSEREIHRILERQPGGTLNRQQEEDPAHAQHLLNICRWWVAHDLNESGLHTTKMPDPEDQRTFRGGSNPLFPQPLMLYVVTVTTALAPDGIVAELPRPMPKSPGIMRQALAAKIDRSHIVDVMYARRRGTLIPYHILIDRHKNDDLGPEGGYHRTENQREAVGAAAHAAASAAGATCRHWIAADGSRVVENMRRESDQWSKATGIPWRQLLDDFSRIESIGEATNIAEALTQLS